MRRPTGSLAFGIRMKRGLVRERRLYGADRPRPLSLDRF